jgi:hypothetical protein
MKVGLTVGEGDGRKVGLAEGTSVGDKVGVDEGAMVGLIVGFNVGDKVVDVGTAPIAVYTTLTALLKKSVKYRTG